MGWEDDDAFGKIWDLGSYLTPDYITYPISKMIERDAARAGIDIHDPFRRTATFASAAFLGAVCGTFLGPLGGAIGGLMGQVIGLAAKREGEGSKSQRIADLNAFAALRLKAFDVAWNVAKRHTSSNTWSLIQDRVGNDVDRYVKSWTDRDETLSNCYQFIDGLENVICHSINRCDDGVYWNFYHVYTSAKKEMNIH